MINAPTVPLFDRRILIVEDNPQVRQVIARLLEIEGFTVLQAQDGISALKILKLITPDLILSDITMPRMNGLDFFRSVRKELSWEAIPFIFLTSSDAPDDIQAGKELGVEDYLLKPIDGAKLVRIVNARLLRASRVQIALMDQAYLETVTVLANTIEGRDHYTAEHVDRVTEYALCLAKALQWSEELLRNLEFGARLHDIGKIIIPDQILNKPGPLTHEEWVLMKRHPGEGARILKEIKHLQSVIPYALYHHERWDGSGYPLGLRGRAIPLEGRLLALVDVYDALTTNRPYHPARSKNEVIIFLRHNSGTHFDPDLVPIFLEIIG